MDFIRRMRSRAQSRRTGAYLGERLGKTLCFVQGDQNVANQAGSLYRADVNNELQALVTLSSGTSAPSTTYAHQFWADTSNNLLKKRNAANSAWIVVRTLDEAFVVSRSSNTILAGSDVGKTFVATAGFTQTLTAAATLGDGWAVAYRVESGATLVLDPNASENIDGATTKSVVGPASGWIFCNGSGFYTVGFPVVTGSGLASGSALTITVTAATKAQQQSASSSTVAVTPAIQHQHDSAAKAWGHVTPATTVDMSYPTVGVSVVKNSTGNFTVTHGVTFTNSNYAIFVTMHRSVWGTVVITAQTTTTFTVQFNDNTPGLAVDPSAFSYACFGQL